MFEKKRQIIILSVINDIATDQRVQRIANTLTNIGAQVLVVGRQLPSSLAIVNKAYQTRRFKLLINKSFLFYGLYNIRLFFYLLFSKADILVANDLDTLPANFIVSKIKRIPLVYDSHEFFTEVPELQNRKFVRNIWLGIEQLILPRIKNSYTVCNSIANIYKEKYLINMQVVRNLPYKLNLPDDQSSFNKYPKTIIYQGALNVGRGIENVIKAMQYIDNVEFIIAGEGDISNELKMLALQLNLSKKVKFIGRINPNELITYTQNAWLGLSLEENMGLNYYYSLPNKLFDYIQAGIPVLVSDFPETSKIVKTYNVGRCTLERDPEKIADIINQMLTENEERKNWIANSKKAANELCWENEETKIIEIYKMAGIKNEK